MTEFTPLDAMREWKARALAAEATLDRVRALGKDYETMDYGEFMLTTQAALLEFARRLRECLGEKA